MMAQRGRGCASQRSTPRRSRLTRVDVTGYLDRGIESLRCHELYLSNLGGDREDVGEHLRSSAESVGTQFGVQHAVAFELVNF